jgi:hypothetical protein
MDQLDDFFHIVFSNDHMMAEILLKEENILPDFSIDEDMLMKFLRDSGIKNGLAEEAIRLLYTNLSPDLFPLVIAKGTPAIHGKDGKVDFVTSIHPTEIQRTPGWNFRDIMQIPVVKKGEKIANVMMPTRGENGKTVKGEIVPAKQGKPSNMKAGKNTIFSEQEQYFYAAASGQLSVSGRNIHVHPVYEVSETLSMKEGNLAFTGTIIIRGDIPSGYTVKADGDIKVFGIVEAATLISGGSIFISEGFAGQKKGVIRAKETIQLGYINQGKVLAGNDLFVENSIIHSVCTVKNHVFCQKGNVIGGILSVGKSMEAKDVGSRFGTATEIVFGADQALKNQEQELMNERKELLDNIQKLTILGKKLKREDNRENPKTKAMLRKQKKSHANAMKKLTELETVMGEPAAEIGSKTEAELIVKNHLFSHVSVAFGKYKRMIKTDYHNVKVYMQKNEIVIEPLFY